MAPALFFRDDLCHCARREATLHPARNQNFAPNGGVMNITATSTVSDLAAGVPCATRVFENLGIDYCCGGHRTLAAACREANLPVEDLTRSLEESGRASQPG